MTDMKIFFDQTSQISGAEIERENFSRIIADSPRAREIRSSFLIVVTSSLRTLMETTLAFGSNPKLRPSLPLPPPHRSILNRPSERVASTFLPACARRFAADNTCAQEFRNLHRARDARGWVCAAPLMKVDENGGKTLSLRATPSTFSPPSPPPLSPRYFSFFGCYSCICVVRRKRKVGLRKARVGGRGVGRKPWKRKALLKATSG